MRILIFATLFAMALSLPGIIALTYAGQDKNAQTYKSTEQSEEHNVNAQDESRDMHGQEYIVEKGDTLAEISEKFLGTQEKWPEIAKANDLPNPDQIDVGDHLLIPDASANKKDEFNKEPKEQNLGNTTGSAGKSNQMDENSKPMP
jgi:LysM repeat protein